MRPYTSPRQRTSLLAVLAALLIQSTSMAAEHPAKLSISYADPIVQGRYEHVLRKHGVAFKYSTLQGQKAVLIEGLSPREVAEKTREFDEWLLTYRAPQADEPPSAD